MKINNTKGSIYILVSIITTLFLSLGITSISFVLNQTKLANQQYYKAKAFHIAEAGTEYYRWHLAHVTDDFQDGTGAPGPYVHQYTDADGIQIGAFTLNIQPPPQGSTLVEIQSSGISDKKPKLTRIIKTILGRPSFTNYAVVANDNMRFGEGTEAFGPIHSNYGIRFDGLAHNVVSSSEETYNDPDHGGADEWAVHTHLDPIDQEPPTPMAQRVDVFEAGREVAVGSVNFTSISGELDNMQQAAATDGIYLSDSGTEGYRVHFRTDQKVEIYRVTSQQTCQREVCIWIWCWWTNYSSTSLWSVDQQETFDYQGTNSANLDIPANGLIFIEDDVWVDGQINNNRITVVAAKTPYSTGNANIITNDDLLYSNYDGTDSIGLIAQNNIRAGFYSEDDLRVDAAMIAQKGNVGRSYYPASSGTFNPAGCNENYVRDTFTNYGSIGSNQRYGYAYVCDTPPNCGGWLEPPCCAPCGTTSSGYCLRNLLYDDSLYFAPPPYFPATDQYRIITWEQT